MSVLFHWFQSWKNIKMPNWSSGNIFAKCEQVFRPEGSKYCRSWSKTFQQLYSWLPGFASAMSQTTLHPGNNTPRVVDTPRPRVNTSESWEGGENIQTKNIAERQGWVFLIKALLNIWRRKITFLHVHNTGWFFSLVPPRKVLSMELVPPNREKLLSSPRMAKIPI